MGSLVSRGSGERHVEVHFPDEHARPGLRKCVRPAGRQEEGSRGREESSGLPSARVHGPQAVWYTAFDESPLLLKVQGLEVEVGRGE